MDIQSSVLSEIFVLYPVHVPSWLTPVKPPTLAHGGISWLLYNGNSTGLLCVVDPWAELQLRGQIMEAYDSVALYLNDVTTPVDSATVLPGDEQKRIPLNVPHGQLIHGVNRLHYKVTRLSGNVEPSRDLLVLYHLRVPANLDLVIPPDVVANGVSAARAAQGVEFRLSYVTVEKYDIARLQIGNQSFTLEVSDPAKPVTKTLYLEDFKTVGDGRFEIDFVVTDQLGNSAISATKTLDVHIARLDLPPPTVRGQSGNNFSPTQPEIRVLVPQGPLLPPDKLSVTWAGAIAVPAASYTSPQRLVSAGLEIAVPRSVLAYSLGKTVTVTYTVERNGVPTTSPPLTLNILPLPATALNPPKIVEADASNVLDIIALGTKNATIHALLHTLIETGQHCWLILLGKKADGTAHNLTLWSGYPAKVNDTWVSQGFWPAALANSYLKQLGHGTTLTIKYKVALDKSNLEANAVVFPDRVYTIKAVELVIPTLTNVLDEQGVEVLEAGFTVSTSLTLKGAASKGLQVEIFDGSGASAVSKGKATADKDTGLWSLTITVPVGARRLYAKSLYHSTSVYSNVRILTVMVLQPPTLLAPAVNPIDPALYPNGITIRVEYLQAQEKAEAKLIWLNSLPGTPTFDAVELNKNKHANFVIENSLLQQHQGRELRLQWVLIQQGVSTESPILPLTIIDTATSLSFYNAPYILGPAGQFTVSLELAKDGIPLPEGTIILTLPNGFSFNDGASGSRSFITDSNGKLIVDGVRGSNTSGVYTLTASHQNKTVTSAATVTKPENVGAITGTRYPYDITISPDGTRAYIVGFHLPENYAALLKVDIITQRVIGSLVLGNSLTSVAVSPDNSSVYVTSGGHSLFKVDSDRFEAIGSVAFSFFPHYVAINSSGSLAFVSGATVDFQNNGRLAVVDTASLRVLHTMNLFQMNTSSVALNPDGSRVYVTNANGDGGGSVSVIDTQNYQILRNIQVGSNPHGIVVSPDGSRIYTVRTDGDVLVVIDARTNAVIRYVPLGIGAWHLALSRDGRYLCASEWNNGSKIVIVDTASFTFRTLVVGREPIGVAFNSEGSRIYVCRYLDNVVLVIANE